MPAWDYAVQRLTIDSTGNSDAALAEALRSAGEESWELVSCVPEHGAGRSPIHEMPVAEAGSDPYDAVWQAPTGTTYVAVFKRPV